MPRYKDITGQRFGKLVALAVAGSTANGEAKWLCVCDCGGERIVAGFRLRSSIITHCGCGKLNRKHGMAGHRLYNIWTGMKQRCSNPNSVFYHRYGGRGIAICSEWATSFEAFSAWALHNGYKDDLQIDRIDNDGNYEPDNCRWATPKVNNRNRENNRRVKWRGRLVTLPELAEASGIELSCLRHRIDVMRLPVGKALAYDPMKDCYRNNTSGATNVHLHQGSGKWRVCFDRGGHRFDLGLFSDLDAAVEARDSALRELEGL